MPISANDYQRTKVAADAVATEAVRQGFPMVRVYPGVVYGPGSRTEGNLLGRLIADHLKGRLPGLIGPEMPWSFAYVDDVAAGTAKRSSAGDRAAGYALGGENAPQLRAFEIVAAGDRAQAAAAGSRFRSRPMLGVAEEMPRRHVRRYAARDARRRGDLPPRLVARQQRCGARPAATR